jgi:hypothetical protein
MTGPLPTRPVRRALFASDLVRDRLTAMTVVVIRRRKVDLFEVRRKLGVAKTRS